MMSPANALNQPKSTRRISLLLVSLMLTSVWLALYLLCLLLTRRPTIQHEIQQPSAGDLDCDGDDDIVTGSEMGNFLTILYNDNGDFSDDKMYGQLTIIHVGLVSTIFPTPQKLKSEISMETPVLI